MIKDLKESSKLEEMSATLKEEGVFKILNFMAGDELSSLHDEGLNLCSNNSGFYEFGRNYRGESLESYAKSSFIYQTYNKSWMKDLHKLYCPSSLPTGYGINVFATHDYKSNTNLARNGWLHFDRLWRLKFFIYLTDIDVSSGAFYCSPFSRLKGKELRVSDSKVGYENMKNRIEIDYPNLLDEFPPEPVEAPAGTLIVFDTDTFHKGGIVDEGKSRLVVRLHCAT